MKEFLFWSTVESIMSIVQGPHEMLQKKLANDKS